MCHPSPPSLKNDNLTYTFIAIITKECNPNLSPSPLPLGAWRQIWMFPTIRLFHTLGIRFEINS